MENFWSTLPENICKSPCTVIHMSGNADMQIISASTVRMLVFLKDLIFDAWYSLLFSDILPAWQLPVQTSGLSSDINPCSYHTIAMLHVINSLLLCQVFVQRLRIGCLTSNK